MTEEIEKLAWNCNEWPSALSDQVEACMEVSDEMSTEQVLAYAILMERERCIRACDEEIERARSFGPHHIPIISSIRKAIRAS